MEKVQKKNGETKEIIRRYRTFRYELIAEGVAVGALSGLVVVAFRYLVAYGDAILHAILNFARENLWCIPLWFVFLLAAAFVVSKLLQWEPLISGSGIPQVEGEMLGEFDSCWYRVLLAKLAGGLLSLGCGLSLGREGPSIQLGAMMAKGVSRVLGRVKTEEKLLMTCGATAGLSAAFNAPIAGVLFSLEEIHRHFSPEVLLSCMASSITADFVSRNVFGLKPVFHFQDIEMLPLADYGHVLALGLLLGIMGVVYNRSIKMSQDCFQKISTHTVRLMVPFLLAGIFGFLYPAVLGGGHSLVEELSSGNMILSGLLLLFLLKFLFSMVSFGSGAPGGIFLPLLVLGAVIGSIYYQGADMFFVSLDGFLGNFIILGMAGYFSAIVRAPITGIILISEMTGSFSHLLTLSIVSLVAYIVPDFLRCPPIYDQLLHRLLAKEKKTDSNLSHVEKILVEGTIAHGSRAEGSRISQMPWPRNCLVVSLMRGEEETLPHGQTKLQAGDRIVVLCDETAESSLKKIIQEECETVEV